MARPGHTSPHLPVREDWLALRQEEILDPGLPIVDAHHHLWDRPDARYLLEDMLRDAGSGHDIRATVYVQARSMYRADGPEELRSLGETEFANGVAARSASGLYGPVRACAGIVGMVDLMLGDAVAPLLEASDAPVVVNVSSSVGSSTTGASFPAMSWMMALP